MTDGTSQGLFIVVAIVIFGIFVVLAYILFEDTLSPSLASMFTEATEKASDSVKGYVKLEVDKYDFLHAPSNHMVFDLKKQYTDTGDIVDHYAGTFGKGTGDVFSFPLMSYVNGRETYTVGIAQIYFEQVVLTSEKTDVVRGEVKINGKVVPSTLWSEIKPHKRYYLRVPNIFLDKNKEHNIEVRLYTDTKEFFEFQKTIVIQ